MGRALASIACFALGAAGCAPTVGPASSCELDRAYEVVYRIDGRPAYVGQALLIQSCGAEGIYCHAEAADPGDRFGVPAGLDFAALPLSGDPRFELEELAALARAQEAIYRHRDAIWASILDGSMPPGELGAEHQASPDQRYYLDIAEPRIPMPTIDDPGAREALRNWLACEAPVVERFRPPAEPITCTVDAHCPVSLECDIGVSECIGVGEVVPALEVAYTADFPSIWDRILRPACADVEAGCHGEDPSAELDLSSPEVALAGLLADAAPTDPVTGALCGGRGLRRVVPGDPMASLLYLKITRRTDCGTEMPLGFPLSEAQVDAIEEWIVMLTEE